MATDEEDEVAAIIRKAIEKRRGHADFFEWPDRDRAELGVVEDLAASLEATGVTFFSDPKSRGRPNDPPDCEAIDKDGQRIAIEVSELVDGKAISKIHAARRSGLTGESWVEWDLMKFKSAVSERLTTKNACYPRLKDAPYPGGYVVVLHTDEDALSRKVIEEFAGQVTFANCNHIDRAFILISYDPEIERYPFVELQLARG
jgi:hypothetical protein